MSAPARKLTAILAAEVAGYQFPAMLEMGHSRYSPFGLAMRDAEVEAETAV